MSAQFANGHVRVKKVEQRHASCLFKLHLKGTRFDLRSKPSSKTTLVPVAKI